MKLNIKDQISNDLREVISHLDVARVALEVTKPADSNWGDYTTNVALKLAAVANTKPSQIANKIQAELKDKSHHYHTQVAPNGFINFTLSDQFLQDIVSEINLQGQHFGSNDVGRGKKIQVEFVSANPTGPLTLGNGRGGFTGDTIANLLKFCGYEVEREYYVNNVGNQIKVLGYSIARALGLVSEELEEFYAGDYISDLANNLKEEISTLNPSGDDLFYTKVGQLAAAVLLQDIQRVVKAKLGISFDRYYLESTIYDDGLDKKYLSQLHDKGLTYEKDGAIWFKTSELGDDKDRVLVRADGVATYFLSDIVHKNLFANDFDKEVLLLGADHYGYQARLQAGLKAFGHEDKLDIIIFQLVRLMKDGQEVRMSKRAGTYVAIEDLIDEVGVDVARFFFLMHAPNTHLDFDLELAKKKSNDNPVYYVQYAHARLSSILRKAEIGSDEPDLTRLTHPKEKELISHLIGFPELVEDLVATYNIQRLPFYTLSLAEKLHSFYQDCLVISDDVQLTQARLALVKAVQITLKNSLGLMGISAPEEMRHD